MTKQVAHDEVLYHIALSKDMIEGAEYALLPGDPFRVPSLAQSFDPAAKKLAFNREHQSYLANFHGQKVLVISTGMGAPSTGIAVEELATLGIKYFLRVGTCGAIQANINLSDIIISTACVRLEGTSSHYAPIEYPAVSSFEFTQDLVTAAKKIDVPYHVGITASSDTFWPGQERHDNFSGYILRKWVGSMAEWRALHVLNFEMEAAALFTMCNAFGLNAGCICGVVARRVESETPNTDAKKGAADNWQKLAVAGVYESMKRRGLIHE